MAVHWDEQRLHEELKAAAMRGILRGCELIRNDIVDQLLDTRKTGKIYRRGGVEHQASAPWESPATDTGRLVNSVDITLKDDALLGIVSVNTEYAAMLEFGTVNMEPRPFVRPAGARSAKHINEMIQAEIDRVMKSVK